MSQSVWVYADWHPMSAPMLVGRLEVDLVRGAEVYYFAYESNWLDSNNWQILLGFISNGFTHFYQAIGSLYCVRRRGSE